MERLKPKKTQRGPNRILDKDQYAHLDDIRQDVTDFRASNGVTKYHERMPQMIYRMAAVGMIIEEIARHLEVHEETLRRWIQSRSEVTEAYERGKWESIQLVRESLYRRALGYEYDEVKHFEGEDSLGRPWSKTVTTVKRVEPSDTALIFLLKNRDPDNWRDVWNIPPGGTNNTQVNINNTLNLDSLSEADRKLVARVAMARIIDEQDTHEAVE
jgi:hypothetical protein